MPSRVVKKARPKFHYVKSRQGKAIHLLRHEHFDYRKPLSVVTIVFRDAKFPKRIVPFVIARTACGSEIRHGELVEPDGDHPDICRTCANPELLATKERFMRYGR